MTKIITLQDPFDNGSERVESFTFHECTGADLRSLPVGAATVGDLLTVASKLSDVPGAVMLKLSGRDAIAVATAVGELVQGGQTTGET